MSGRGTSTRWIDSWVTGGIAGIVLGVVLDLALGANISGIMALPPIAASLGANARRTGTVGVMALAAALGLAVHDSTPVATASVRLAATAVAAALAVMTAGRREHASQRLETVERVADLAQHAILLPIPTAIGPYRLASAYISASRESQLGGDFYELVDSPFGARLIVGDVRGKGVEGIELAAVALRCFRDAALTRPNALDVVRAVDACLSSGMHAEDFITAAIIELGPDGELVLVNCGHHPPARIGPQGWQLVEETAHTPPFGFGPAPHEQRLRLGRGERLLVYTDGLVEARRPTGEFIALDEFVNGLDDLAPADALNRIIDTVRIATGGTIRDDVAAVLIERNVA